MAYRSKNLIKRRRGRKNYKAMKKSLGKPAARAVKAIVRSQMNKVIETKTADYLFEPVPLSCFYHNVWYLFESDPLSINQGIQDSQVVNPANRIGDSVFAKGIQFRILFTNFYNSSNNAIRIVILKCKAGSSAITNPSYHAQLANNIITPVFIEDARIKSVVYDKTFTHLSSEAASNANIADKLFLWNHYVKINKKIKYDEGGAPSGNDTYRIYAVMYNTQSASQLTNVGRFSYYRRTYFQDA